MEPDERTGLVVLVAFLVISTLFCRFSMGNGRAISNIFMNTISNTDYPPSSALEAQLEPLMQPLGASWLIGGILGAVGLITLCCIGVYMLRRRRIPRSWCLFLIGVGALAGLLILDASRLQTQIAAIPVPAPPAGTGGYEGLAAAAGSVTTLGEVGGALGLVGVGLFGWSLIFQRRSDSEDSQPLA